MKKLLVLLLVIILSGCVRQMIVDDVNLLNGIGFDKEGHDIRVTTLVPQYQPNKETKNETYSHVGKLETNTTKAANNQTAKPFAHGTLEVVLIQKELAKEGIFELLDQVRRHPEIGSRVYLLIADHSARDILETDHSPIPTATIISELIEHNTKFGMLPKTNLHIFRSTHTNEGIDPILPVITIMDNKITLKGIALFQDDHYNSMIEDQEETFVFKLLLEKTDLRDSLTLHLKDESAIVRIEEFNSKRNFSIKKAMSSPEITIDIKLKAYVTEYSKGQITKKIKAQIEKEVAEAIEQKALMLISHFQEEQIDPLGIGLEVKIRTRNWTQEKWNTLYPLATFKVHANVDVIHYGVYE